MFRTKLLLAVLCALAIGGPAGAQEAFPSHPIRLIVPNPPGGTTDILARLLADELTASLGQPVVIDYRAGASGTVGSDLVAKAKPDGYNLVMGHAASHATSPHMIRTLPYDPAKDFAPVTLVANVLNVIIVNPQIPAKSIEELVALGKAKPGSLSYGSGGVGAITHLAGELFEQMAGVDFLHVPYKGSSQAMTDLLGGHVAMMFENLPGAMGNIKAGTVRPLGVTGPNRSPALPEVPTVSESGLPGYEALSWFGLFTTGGTPKPVVDKLNREIVAVIRKPAVQARMRELGAEPVGSTAEAFEVLVRSEIEKWGKVIKAANIQPN
jgi:tripartite-type tricarboxylate transporter receptor subunit TctC